MQGLRFAVLSLLLIGGGSLGAGQLFENLKDFSSRISVGDPATTSTWGGNEGPKGIAQADLDGDLDPDLVVSNLDATISVLLNENGTRFAPPVHLRLQTRGPMGSSLRGVVVANLDFDELPDIASADLLGGRIVVFRNQGNARFLEEPPIPAWFGVRNLVAGDFDGDGAAELVAAGLEVMEQFERQSGGPFESLGRISLERAQWKQFFPMKVIRGIPGEGDSLIVTHSDADRIWGLGADENGVLRVEWSFFVGDPGTELDIYSLDMGPIFPESVSEGLDDLVTAHRDLGVVQVRRGARGAIPFLREVHQEIRIPGGPRWVLLTDMDRDGRNDLVVLARNLDRVFAFRNEGGTFQLSTEMPVGKSPREMVVADLNLDGSPDLAVINRESQDVSILSGHPGQVGFSALDQFYLVDGEVSALEVVDLDDDRRDDVVQLHRASGDVSIRLAGEGGVLGPPAFHPMGDLPSALEVLDVDLDGRLDLITANLGRDRGSISVRRGLGGGAMGPELRSELPGALKGGFFALEAADLDGDGRIDLAAGFLDCRLGFLAGRGDGFFDLIDAFAFIYEARAMQVGDFDRDGDLDLAAAGLQGDLMVLENPGDLLRARLTGNERRTYFAEPGPESFGARDLKVEDVNGDDDLDLILGTGRGVFVYHGAAGTDFGPALAMPHTEFSVSRLVLADLDGEGPVDAAVACDLLSCVTVLTRSQEADPWTPVLSIDVPAGRLLAVGKVDGDESDDLVGSGQVLWTALSGRRAALVGPPVGEGERTVIPSLFINEIQARNTDSRLDENDPGTPDWVELHNGGASAVTLSGLSLELHRNGLAVDRHRFGEVAIPGGGHRVVHSNDLGFKLPGEGAVLVLRDGKGSELDRVAYPPQREDVSYARYRDGLPAFVFNLFPSPGAANTDNGSVLPLVTLEGAFPPGRGPLDPFRPLAPGEPIILRARASDDVGVMSVSVLSIRPSDPEGKPRRTILYDDGEHDDGETQDGRFAGVMMEGIPAGSVLHLFLEVHDLGDNVQLVPEEAAVDQEREELYSISLVTLEGLEISEVMAINTSGPDWVEVRNVSPQAIRLDGVSLGKNYPSTENWFRFPAGRTIGPGEHLVIFCRGDDDPERLEAPFRVSGQGDRLFLCGKDLRGANAIYDVVELGRQEPDRSLARRRGEWRADSAPTPGAPNEGETFPRGDADRSGGLDIADAIVILSHLFQGGSLSCSPAAEINGDGLVDLSDAIRLLGHLFLGVEAPEGGPVFCP